MCLLLSTFEKVHSQTKQLKEIKENLTILYLYELEENKTLDLTNFVTQTIVSTVTLTAIVREKRQEEGEGRLFPPISLDQNQPESSTTKSTHFLQTNYYEEQLEGRLIRPKFVDKTNFFENFSIYNNHTQKPIDALFTPTIKPIIINQNATPTTGHLTTIKPDHQIPSKKHPPKHTVTTLRPLIKLITTTTKPSIIKDDKTTTESTTIYPVTDDNMITTMDNNDSFVTDVELTTKRKRIITTTEAPNCTQEETVIDPFKLFEFAQKLEREGFQNYTTTLKGL